MTLPSSGQITAAMINSEMGYPSNRQLSLNAAGPRYLAGRTASGSSIAFSHFRGKSMEFLNATLVGVYDPRFNSFGYIYGVLLDGCAEPASSRKQSSLNPNAAVAGSYLADPGVSSGTNRFTHMEDKGSITHNYCFNGSEQGSRTGPYYPVVRHGFCTSNSNSPAGISDAVGTVVINGVARNVASYNNSNAGTGWCLNNNGVSASGAYFGRRTVNVKVQG